MTRAAVLGVLLVLGTSSGLRAADPIQIATAARSVQPGELVVFTATADAPIDMLWARALDRDLPTYRVDSQTWQALLGIDLDTPPRPYVVSFDAQIQGLDVSSSTTVVVTTKRFATRTLRVNDAFVNPPRATLERITAEAAELREVWTHSASSRLWSEAFVRPVPGRATSSFGVRSVFNGAPRQPHGGADFMSPSGTPILAPNAGRVVIARDLYFTGNTIVIDHGLGVFSMLAHLSAMDVHAGDDVTVGQIVGHVGATGRVTGPHLHWAVRVGDARVDPLSLLAILGAAPATP